MNLYHVPAPHDLHTATLVCAGNVLGNVLGSVGIVPPLVHHPEPFNVLWRALHEKLEQVIGETNGVNVGQLMGTLAAPLLSARLLPPGQFTAQITTLLADQASGPQPLAVKLACAQAVFENTVLLFDIGTPPYQSLRGMLAGDLLDRQPLATGLRTPDAAAPLPNLYDVDLVDIDPGHDAHRPNDPRVCFPGLPAACLSNIACDMPVEGPPDAAPAVAWARAEVNPVVVVDGERVYRYLPREMLPGWEEDMVLYNLSTCNPTAVVPLHSFEIRREWPWVPNLEW